MVSAITVIILTIQNFYVFHANFPWDKLLNVDLDMDTAEQNLTNFFTYKNIEQGPNKPTKVWSSSASWINTKFRKLAQKKKRLYERARKMGKQRDSDTLKQAKHKLS